MAANGGRPFVGWTRGKRDHPRGRPTRGPRGPGPLRPRPGDDDQRCVPGGPSAFWLETRRACSAAGGLAEGSTLGRHRLVGLGRDGERHRATGRDRPLRLRHRSSDNATSTRGTRDSHATSRPTAFRGLPGRALDLPGLGDGRAAQADRAPRDPAELGPVSPERVRAPLLVAPPRPARGTKRPCSGRSGRRRRRLLGSSRPSAGIWAAPVVSWPWPIGCGERRP